MQIGSAAFGRRFPLSRLEVIKGRYLHTHYQFGAYPLPSTKLGTHIEFPAPGTSPNASAKRSLQLRGPSRIKSNAQRRWHSPTPMATLSALMLAKMLPGTAKGACIVFAPFGPFRYGSITLDEPATIRSGDSKEIGCLVAKANSMAEESEVLSSFFLILT